MIFWSIIAGAVLTGIGPALIGLAIALDIFCSSAGISYNGNEVVLLWLIFFSFPMIGWVTAKIVSSVLVPVPYLEFVSALAGLLLALKSPDFLVFLSTAVLRFNSGPLDIVGSSVAVVNAILFCAFLIATAITLCILAFELPFAWYGGTSMVTKIVPPYAIRLPMVALVLYLSFNLILALVAQEISPLRLLLK